MNSLQELSQDITDRTLLQTINAAKSVLHDNISIAKMNRHMRRQKCTTGKCSSPKIPAAQSVDDEEETLESVTCTDCSLHPGSLADSVEEDDDIKTVAASNQYSDHVAPGPALLTRRKGWRERPHTALETVSTAKPSRTRRKPKSAVTRKQMPVQRKPVPLPYQMYKYKRPDSNSIKRNYRQLWNEKGQLSKKDTEYIEIHYDRYQPGAFSHSRDRQLAPKRYSSNHKNGYHWEIRYRTPALEPRQPLKKVERVWENEFNVFKLDKMLDKKLSLSS